MRQQSIKSAHGIIAIIKLPRNYFLWFLLTLRAPGGGVSNVDIDGKNTLQIKGIGVTISTFETLPGFVAESRWRHLGLGSGSRHSGHYESRTGSNRLPLTRGKGECENAESSRNWTAGCGESYLSGAGSAGRKSTAERQHGRRPSTP